MLRYIVERGCGCELPRRFWTCSVRRAAYGAVLVALGMGTGGAGSAFGRPATERVSVRGTAGQANGFSPGFASVGYGRSLAVSAHGRFVAFESEATNLALSDTNRSPDVFVRDRMRHRTERVSVSSAGAQADGPSGGVAMSPDARFVAFASRASNLVPDDTNELTDVFVRDRRRGTTERVNVSSEGLQTLGEEESESPAISADGRFAMFMSASRDLVPGDDNRVSDVFVRDRRGGLTRRVSVSSAGGQANRGADQAAMSADGRFVVFSSESTNLVRGAPKPSVYLRDLRRGRTTLLKLGRCCAGPWGFDRLAISRDGRVVAFGAARPSGLRLVVWDRLRGSATMVAERGNSAALTADGRTVVFWAHRPDLVPRDSRAYLDLFLYDRRARAIRPLTIGRRDGRRMLGTTGIPAISADGRWLAFASDSAALVRGDTNERSDVFLHGPLSGAGARR